MEEFVRMALLADVYGQLLTDNQRRVIALHYGEDLSLGEIARQLGVSRAAVHDTLRRAQASLELYEGALGVVGAESERKRLVQEAMEALSRAGRELGTKGEAAISKAKAALARIE